MKDTFDSKAMDTFYYSIQIATHFQSINIAHMSLEVLDLDFFQGLAWLGFYLNSSR